MAYGEMMIISPVLEPQQINLYLPKQAWYLRLLEYSQEVAFGGLNLWLITSVNSFIYTLCPPFQENRPWMPRKPMNIEQPPMALKSIYITHTMDDMLRKCFQTQLKIPIRILHFLQLAHITRMVFLGLTLQFLLWERELSFYMRGGTSLNQSLPCYGPLPCWLLQNATMNLSLMQT